MNLSKQILLVCAGIAFGAVAANAQNEPQMQGHRGLDLNVELGPDFGLQKGGGTAFAAKLDVGKKFNKNFYFGVGGGITTGGGATSFPVFGTLRTYIPSESTKIIPTATLRGGYAFNGDCPFVSLAPGMLFPISSSIDLTAGVEYTASFASGQTGHSLGVHIGLGLHKSANSVKKPWAQTREKGLQYVIDGGAKFGEYILAGGSILAMYKCSPNISFGAGLGYYAGSIDAANDICDYDEIEGGCFNLFLRGKYTLNDNRVSPFVSVDLGTRLPLKEETVYANHYELMYNGSTYGVKAAEVKPMVFVTPAVGLSLQVAGNSWVDFKAGYDISSAAVKVEKGSAKKISGLTVGISFTHTMNILTNGL